MIHANNCVKNTLETSRLITTHVIMNSQQADGCEWRSFVNYDHITTFIIELELLRKAVFTSTVMQVFVQNTKRDACFVLVKCLSQRNTRRTSVKFFVVNVPFCRIVNKSVFAWVEFNLLWSLHIKVNHTNFYFFSIA